MKPGGQVDTGAELFADRSVDSVSARERRPKR